METEIPGGDTIVLKVMYELRLVMSVKGSDHIIRGSQVSSRAAFDLESGDE